MINRKRCGIENQKNICKTNLQPFGCGGRQKQIIITGPTGPRGFRGITGPTGPANGEVIARQTITVTENEPANVVSTTVGNKTYLDFYIPKGKDGTTDTIKAGNVETINATEKAEVNDRIENNTHYFDFKLPRGFDGEKGEGEQISIDCVTTVDFNEPARVEDNFENNVHNLSFFIPRGAPYLNSKTIVSMNKNSNQIIDTVNTLIEFEDSKNIENANVSNTSCEVLVQGLYKVDVGVMLKVNQPVQISLCNNDEPIAYGTLHFDANTSYVGKSFVLNLQVNDKISLKVTSLTAGFNFAKDISFAYFNITPIPY